MLYLCSDRARPGWQRIHLLCVCRVCKVCPSRDILCTWITTAPWHHTLSPAYSTAIWVIYCFNDISICFGAHRPKNNFNFWPFLFKSVCQSWWYTLIVLAFDSWGYSGLERSVRHIACEFDSTEKKRKEGHPIRISLSCRMFWWSFWEKLIESLQHFWLSGGPASNGIFCCFLTFQCLDLHSGLRTLITMSCLTSSWATRHRFA